MAAPPDPATTTHRLATGETLLVRIVEPPLGDDAGRIEYWWRDVRAPLVAGELADTGRDRFVIAEIDGAYVGSMIYSTARDAPAVAVLEMVWTHPDHRRKGIADIILGRLLDDFRAAGGRAIYLCTVNPHAAALYARHGFAPLIGDGMRYLAPGGEDFDRTYFAAAGPATARPGTWGDLARIAALYNQPAPDWLIKDYARRVFRGVRYESHYLRPWLASTTGRGQLRVLESPRGALVGIASLTEVDSFHEQHARVLECWACPAYLAALPALIAGLIAAAPGQGAEIVQAYVAAADAEKRALLAGAGLREEARLPGRLRVGDERDDLLIYARHLGPVAEPAHPASAYYGARPSWR